MAKASFFPHRLRAAPRRAPLAAVAVGLLGLALAGCTGGSAASEHPLGDPAQGAKLVDEEACGSCHSIPGKAEGNGLVGPPLAHMATRAMIAGVLPNTPDNMVAWLRTPQSVVPGNAMPNMGLSPRQATDIAAYLYTLD